MHRHKAKTPSQHRQSGRLQVDRLFVQPNVFGYKYPDFCLFLLDSYDFFTFLRSSLVLHFNTRVNVYENNLVTVSSVDLYLKAHTPPDLLSCCLLLHVICYYSPHTDFRRPDSSALRGRWSTNNRVGNTFTFLYIFSCV